MVCKNVHLPSLWTTRISLLQRGGFFPSQLDVPCSGREPDLPAGYPCKMILLSSSFPERTRGLLQGHEMLWTIQAIPTVFLDNFLSRGCFPVIPAEGFWNIRSESLLLQELPKSYQCHLWGSLASLNPRNEGILGATESILSEAIKSDLAFSYILLLLLK